MALFEPVNLILLAIALIIFAIVFWLSGDRD